MAMKGGALMIGIYCFTNKISNKKYIGQSRDLETRKKSHLRNYDNPNLVTYNGLFYRAIRKYGIDNFDYEILYKEDNFLSQNVLNELEHYYIKLYDSYGENGYNMNEGGRFTSSEKALNAEQAKSIQEEILNSELSFIDISKKYNVSESTISMINKGIIWNHIKERDYPLRKNTRTNNIGGKNPNAVLTDEIVTQLRETFVNKSLSDLQKEYNVPFSTLKKAVYGVSFQHLPVYKKREKKWFLNGTCIDYPRIEE